MPYTNRVDPFGTIFATPARGALMGNRGCLHDAHKNIIRPWARKAWISCLLDFKGRHRNIMSPGQYTELFFLDEATALSAGHRPCATCQRQKYQCFKTLWFKANPGSKSSQAISKIDETLHNERYASRGASGLPEAQLGTLPDGTFVIRKDKPMTAFLYFMEHLFEWHPEAYGQPLKTPASLMVRVLTPASIVRTLAAGYSPDIHGDTRELNT